MNEQKKQATYTISKLKCGPEQKLIVILKSLNPVTSTPSLSSNSLRPPILRLDIPTPRGDHHFSKLQFRKVHQNIVRLAPLDDRRHHLRPVLIGLITSSEPEITDNYQILRLHSSDRLTQAPALFCIQSLCPPHEPSSHATHGSVGSRYSRA